MINNGERLRTAPKIKAEMLPFGLVFAHGFLFFIQGVVVTLSSAIYFDIFLEANILKPNEKDKTPEYFGYFSVSFFIGKLLSDFLWGVIRDCIGDKKTMNLASVAMMICLVAFGFSWNLWSMMTFIFLLGLSSGLFVPGIAFCNWIGEQKRETLVMWIYIFGAAGSLTGPFLGSLFFTIFEHSRLLKTFSCVAVAMLISLLVFNYAFSDYDDRVLIETSKYSDLLEEENNKMRGTFSKEEIEIEMMKRKSKDDKDPYTNNGDEKLGSIVDNLKYIESRKRLQNLGAFEMIKGSLARVLLILSMSLIWGVKLLEFMLFPQWLELDPSKGGLGFDKVMAGAVSLLNFPLMAIILLYLYKWVQKQKASSILFFTSLTLMCVCATTPLIYFAGFSKENMLLMIVPLCAIKESCLTLFLTSWSNLFSRIFPSKTLGRIFSWSYMIGHILLAIFSVTFPKLLTYFLESPAIANRFGSYRITVFFSILVSPILLTLMFVMISKKKLQAQEEILI